MARFIITGEYKDKATKLAIKDLKKLDKQTAMFAKMAKKYYAIASAAAGYYAQKVLKESIKNALDDEKSQRVLALTLANVAGATDAAVIATEQQIAAMQAAYGVTDDLLRPALARLARSSGSASQAVYDLNLALDISAATGKSLEAVTGALGKALDGNYASLQRLGLGIDSSILKTKDQNRIFGQLRTTFASFARNEAATTEGKFRRIAVAADEAKEIIGVALIDSINDIVATQGGVEGLTTAFNDLAYAIGDTLRGFGDLIQGIQDLSNYIPRIVKDGVKWVYQTQTILGVLQKQGKQQRINLALQQAQTRQVISARNAEMTALKTKKEATGDIQNVEKKTLEQLMAEEAARKAGFKITEDIDSIQTVAAAKRLEEARQYKAEVLDAAQAQFQAVKSNYDLLNTVWQTQLTAFDAFLAALKAKSVNIPVNFIGGTMPAPNQTASIADFVPAPSVPAFTGGTAAAGGSSLALGGQTVNITVNAGAIGSEEFLVGEIGNALTKYTRLGNTTAPAGFM